MTENMTDKTTVRAFLSTREMALCSLFAIITGVGAMIKIPLPFSPVPVTLQTAMVFFAGILLGARKASVSMAMYMVMGLIGLPVFTQGGGFHNLLVPSFGFVIGFIPAAWVIGRVCEVAGGRFANSEYKGLAAALLRGVACLAGYAVYNVAGVLWLHLNVNYVMGKSVTLHQSLMMGLVPFILPDMLKMAAVVIVASLVAARVRSLDTFASK